MPRMNFSVFPKIGIGIGPGIFSNGFAFFHSSERQCELLISILFTGHFSLFSNAIFRFTVNETFNKLKRKIYYKTWKKTFHTASRKLNFHLPFFSQVRAIFFIVNIFLDTMNNELMKKANYFNDCLRLLRYYNIITHNS